MHLATHFSRFQCLARGRNCAASAVLFPTSSLRPASPFAMVYCRPLVAHFHQVPLDLLDWCSTGPPDQRVPFPKCHPSLGTVDYRGILGQLRRLLLLWTRRFVLIVRHPYWTFASRAGRRGDRERTPRPPHSEELSADGRSADNARTRCQARPAPARHARDRRVLGLDRADRSRTPACARAWNAGSGVAQVRRMGPDALRRAPPAESDRIHLRSPEPCGASFPGRRHHHDPDLRGDALVDRDSLSASDGGQRLRAGARWKLGTDAILSLEATRDESENAEPEHGIELRADIRW